jgi:hypothetical protein
MCLYDTKLPETAHTHTFTHMSGNKCGGMDRTGMEITFVKL